jgi:DNA-binding transcriptional ArsR family regulator
MVTNRAASARSRDAVFRAVADPTRRSILHSLRAGGRNVAEISGAYPMSRPAVSRHLRILRAAGLVRRRRAGRHEIYELDPAPLKRLDEWLAEYRTL